MISKSIAFCNMIEIESLVQNLWEALLIRLLRLFLGNWYATCSLFDGNNDKPNTSIRRIVAYAVFK